MGSPHFGKHAWLGHALAVFCLLAQRVADTRMNEDGVKRTETLKWHQLFPSADCFVFWSEVSFHWNQLQTRVALLSCCY